MAMGAANNVSALRTQRLENTANAVSSKPSAKTIDTIANGWIALW